MVGSQLLLLVLNVWFLRAFDSSVGQFIGNGGALASGGGSVFLWLFCALAFLKTAQKFDSYLAAMGLNVAQTGSSMAMEMVMAARVLSGLGGGAKSAGSVFRSGGTAASSAATGAGRPPAPSRRDLPASSKATPTSGTRWWRAVPAWAWAAAWALWAGPLGASPPETGRCSPGSPSPPWPAAQEAVSGAIAGDIADRSLQNFMPQLSNYSLAGTQITGGHIHTTATGIAAQEAAEQEGPTVPTPAAGEEGAAVQAAQPTGPSQIDYYSASQYEAPEGPYSVVTAADGSTWYQVATGEGSAAFYDVPEFSGSALEESQVRETFPSVEEGTSLRTVEQGVLEATGENGSALWYNSAFYEEPEAPHRVVQAANGVDWYQMEPPAQAPDFETGGTGPGLQPGFFPELYARLRAAGHHGGRQPQGGGPL